jgi:hypothetical protein
MIDSADLPAKSAGGTHLQARGFKKASLDAFHLRGCRSWAVRLGVVLVRGRLVMSLRLRHAFRMGVTAFVGIFLAVDRPDVGRISIEIRPSYAELFFVRIDPLPQVFACNPSLTTGRTLDADNIGRKPMAIAAAATPAVV